MWNITISTVGANYMCIVIKSFYLGTPIDSFENLRIPVKFNPQEISAEYILLPLAIYGHIYIEVQ
jgi:hypothetical protein